MTPRKFWTACRVHDWTYEYSDDPNVYRNGKEEREHLQSIAEKGGEYKCIYDAWHAYHFDNGAKPEEPKLEDTNETA